MIEFDYGSTGQFPKNIEFSIYDPLIPPQVSEAIKWIGNPSAKYKDPNQGMKPEEGFDCSGFVKFVLENSGIKVPEDIRHASDFFDRFGILVHFGLHKSGDLIFLSRGLYPKHIGIVLNKHEFIHSPGRPNSKIEISKILLKPIVNDDPRAIYNTNPIGFKRIAAPNDRFQIF